MPTWLETERRPPCKRNDAGANPVVGSGLENDGPDGVTDSIGPSEGPGPGSIPGRDTWLRPASVMDGTADFGSARWGSIPQRATERQQVLGVCRTAHDFAEIVDQVRFLAWTLTLRRWSQTARQPAATRSKWVRLPPASLGSKVPTSSGPAAHRFTFTGSDRCVPNMDSDHDDVARG